MANLVGQLRRHGVPVQAAAFARRVVAAVDRFLHVAARLFDHLAHLARHLAGEVFLALHEDAGRFEQHLGPTRRGHQPPFLVSLFCRLNRHVDVFAIGFLKDARHFAGIGGIQVFEAAGRPALQPFAADKILISARLRAGVDAGCALFHRRHDDCLPGEIQTLMLAGVKQVVTWGNCQPSIAGDVAGRCCTLRRRCPVSRT